VKFLRRVQDRHIQTTAYDYMEFADIVDKSTPLAAGTRFGPIFHHTEYRYQAGDITQQTEEHRATRHLTGSFFSIKR
jgi:hypothetical protein